MVLQIGQKAPDFTAQSYLKGEMKEITLSSYAAAGKWTVLFFYPLDFTFVCPTEIKGFDAMIKDFEAANVQVLGASVDSQYSHQAWCQGSLG